MRRRGRHSGDERAAQMMAKRATLIVYAAVRHTRRMKSPAQAERASDVEAK